MLGHEWNPNNHHHGCLDMDWILTIILDDDYCDLIHVQTSLMIIGIWSMSKHPWWWLLQFESCPSLLDDVRWDSINLKASLTLSMPKTYIHIYGHVYVQKSWFSYHGHIYTSSRMHFFILPGRSRVFTVVAERSWLSAPSLAFQLKLDAQR